MDSGKSSAFLPEKLAFGAPTFLWPCNLPQERYYFMKPVPKKEIPDVYYCHNQTLRWPVERLPSTAGPRLKCRSTNWRFDMKNRILMVAGVLTFAVAAFAAPRYVMVTGAGFDVETDQGSAHSTADSNAQTNLQNACPGTLQSPRKIYDQCSGPIDGNYTCSINYTGICQIGN
jgi:hypothetical protein